MEHRFFQWHYVPTLIMFFYLLIVFIVNRYTCFLFCTHIFFSSGEQGDKINCFFSVCKYVSTRITYVLFLCPALDVKVLLFLNNISRACSDYSQNKSYQNFSKLAILSKFWQDFLYIYQIWQQTKRRYFFYNFAKKMVWLKMASIWTAPLI